MQDFKVTKTFVYTEELTVRADNAAQAIELAKVSDDFDKISNDHLQNIEAEPKA